MNLVYSLRKGCSRLATLVLRIEPYYSTPGIGLKCLYIVPDIFISAISGNEWDIDFPGNCYFHSMLLRRIS